jgi:proteasome lid subunit RPN8/RPN11
MFKVNLTTDVLEKISRDVRRPNERIGLLLGKMEDDGLWISDTVPGGNDSDPVSCVFPPKKLAKVADDIINGRIIGRIVGWYHSHPGHGVFMSDIDHDTQYRLLQFSPYVVALVVDSTTDEFGIWEADSTSGLIQLPTDHIRIV